jgi:deoxyadenosine/deoxycytidine kinase
MISGPIAAGKSTLAAELPSSLRLHVEGQEPVALAREVVARLLR